MPSLMTATPMLTGALCCAVGTTGRIPATIHHWNLRGLEAVLAGRCLSEVETGCHVNISIRPMLFYFLLLIRREVIVPSLTLQELMPFLVVYLRHRFPLIGPVRACASANSISTPVSLFEGLVIPLATVRFIRTSGASEGLSTPSQCTLRMDPVSLCVL